MPSGEIGRNMLKRRTAALLPVIAAAAALPLTSASASYAATTLGPFQIMNVAAGNSEGCVQVVSGDSRDVQLVSGPCFATARSLWRFIGVPFGSPFGDVWNIQNVSTGLCMRARANSDFSAVETIDCTGISDERWSIPQGGVGNGSQIVRIRSEISTGGAPCLDLRGGPSTVQSKPIDVFHCARLGDNQAQNFTIF
jgi:hypothetical protein